MRLADLYRGHGRHADAEPIETALGQLLSSADADFLLRQQLQRLQATGSSAAVSAR